MQAPDKYFEQLIESEAKKIMKNLDLEESFLKGKTILDLGSGRSSFGEYINANGGQCFCIDCNIYDLGKFSPNNKIQAFGESLPIESESIDLVVSRLGIPMLAGIRGNFFETATEEEWQLFYLELEKQISEIKRVIKPGGEFRIYPIDLQFLANQAYISTKSDAKEIQEQAMDAAREEAFRLYRLYGFQNAQQKVNKEGAYYLSWVKDEN